MLKKVIAIIKVIATKFAIAFFFASLFFCIFYFVFKEDIDLIFGLASKITIKVNEASDTPLTFDSVKMRLAKYPNYGTVWAHIIIPDIDVDIKVYQGDNLELIKYGAGHFIGSYFPGEGGTIVIDAHNSVYHFGKLTELEIGAQIIIDADYGEFTYEITSTNILKADELNVMPIQDDAEILMLYTCYPTSGFGYKYRRYVVYAKLVEANYEE